VTKRDPLECDGQPSLWYRVSQCGQILKRRPAVALQNGKRDCVSVKYTENMDEEQIKRVLKSRPPAEVRRGLRCSDENQLAAYVDGQLTKQQRTTFERHLSSCESCLDTIAFLAQSGEWSDSQTVPPYLVARARGLVAKKRSGWRWEWAVATAAAACVLLVVSLIVFKSRVQQPIRDDEPLIAQNAERSPAVVNTPTPEPPRPLSTRSVTKPEINRGETPSVRGESSARTESAPRLLFPHEGSVVDRRELDCRWRLVPDAQFYTVRVSGLDGTLMLEQETKESRLKLNDVARLKNDASYYVTVVAHLTDGRAIKSDLVKFRIAKD